MNMGSRDTRGMKEKWKKAWEKMDRAEKAGKGRSERGNGGMMVDRYLNN